LIAIDDFMADRHLAKHPFERDLQTHRMKAPFSSKVRRYLDEHKINYELQSEPGLPGHSKAAWDDQRREQFEAVKRWFYHDWLRIEPKLRTSIVEGISVHLPLFDDNPAVKRVFCPPKETYDPVANADRHYGTPLPPFGELLEMGNVCAFPSRPIPAWPRRSVP
jgi:hypothetical protein